MQYSDCSVLMTLFSHIFVLLFPFLHPWTSWLSVTGSRVWGWGGGGRRAPGGGSGRAGLWCAPQTSKPVFRVSNLHLQLWHYPSNCTLLKAPYKYSNITRTKMSHKIFKSSQFGFKLKVLLTYLAVDLCQQRNGRQCQKSFQKLTQSSVKLRLVSKVEKKIEVRVSTV